MEPFLGQIQPFGFNFAPRGWNKCDGQLLAISQYSALFSLLGTTFGGDGRTSFGLPDLRGRSIVHIGHGPGLSTISWGERGGIEQIYLNQLNMPNHSHSLTNGVANVSVYTTDNTDATNETDAGANALGTAGNMPEVFRENPTAGDKLGGVSISGTTNPTGGSQPFENRNPFLGINVCIAMQGIFPSRN
ncbi:microcystin-dependent protein [Aquimarina sp. MAR_2010_214]|uniref:phage tail protein n=1 Tax=Aquimarina sp. MAR_2010_214 TaxID=1250026 RepID=UPI000C709C37|nr:tail fiber protein [Aquimarina sp. MAR_2010_214]PKV49356.1 microcystin-dependent protein [Aquimarina sp. MAR_2010_214]